MYLCTVSLPNQNWLIRVDVTSGLTGSSATYRRTDAAGEVVEHTNQLGPDNNDIGLAAIAIIEMVHELNWHEITGPICVVHEGAIDQEHLNEVLRQVEPAYAIRDLACSATAH